jgi:hypothetical protein
MACNVNTKVSDTKGVPSHYASLEFWNGGSPIATYSDVDMQIEIYTSNKVLGASLYIYKYHIFSKKQRIDEYIVDSEALAYKYTLEDE